MAEPSAPGVADAGRPTLVVAVGASAGGLEACKRLFAGVPADKGFAFVVVMHLDPGQASHIAEFLAKVTSAEVRQIAGEERVEANRVYVIAPGTSLSIRDGVLQVAGLEGPRYRHRPIDDFLSALAADQGERAVGIVLSGTGNDGAAGLKEIHAAGGLCLVQDPATAEYKGMPDAAVATGVADAVLAPEAIPEVLLDYAVPEHIRPPRRRPAPPVVQDGPRGLDGILALVGKQYGVDFTEYKPGTLARRTARRMALKQIFDWDAYLDLLREDPKELAALYGDVLIDVTRFFRDRAAWEFLEREVVPALLETHQSDVPIRVWSAGCATGEEAYSLAMVFLEQIEKHGSAHRLQVFGSDLSQEALAVARRGLYPPQVVEDVPAQRLRRFFNRAGEQYQVDRSLRDLVTFAAHNLLADPPFANLDLVACRNVLIYLKPQAQERLLELFHFSLRPKGMLWLGTSETIGRRSDLFETVSGAQRLYQPIQVRRASRFTLPQWVPARTPVQGAVPQPEFLPRQPSVTRTLERFMLESRTLPAVAVNRGFEILHFFGRTEPYLKQPAGEARMDLLSWVKPGMYGRLRAGLLQAVNENQVVTISDVRVEREGGRAHIEIVIEPVLATGVEGVFLVSFRDAPPAKGEAVELPTRHGGGDESLVQDLEQELRDTRLELQSTVEQLEAANEEYRASHEELLSLNEELQSSNEELEMSKEELQSLNEELTTVNRQLEDRNEELRTLGADLQNLLVSADVPVLFVDRHFRIRRFTPACSRLMRIADSDVGRPLDHIKLDIRDDSLLADAELVLQKLIPIEAELPSKTGEWFLRRIMTYRTETDRIDGVCITFHDITAQKHSAHASEQARLFAEAIIGSSPLAMLVLDVDLRVVAANGAFYDTFRVSRQETVGQKIFDLGNGQWDIPRLRELLERILAERKEVRAYDVEHDFERVGSRVMRLSATIVERPEGRILISIEDITDLRRAESAAEARTEELIQEHRRKDEFLGMLGHELRNPLMALATGLEVLDRGRDTPELVAAMKRQAGRMRALLDQLLDVGRVVLGKLELEMQPVDVSDLAREAQETISPMIESAGQELTVSLPGQRSVWVVGDALRLSQVLENLLTNASKFTPPGGHIWLTVDATNDVAEVSVRDNGAGMEPEFLDHAFELFIQGPSTLDRAKGGLGLGLPLVRTLVELHGGSVRARSDGLGEGSEFVVTLPRLRSIPRQEPGSAGRAARRPVRSRRILVVEDEVEAARMLAHLLTLEGQDVRVAGEGPTALETARAFRPEVALLDLGLPSMDGYEIAEKLREEFGDAMFLIALTGYGKDGARLDAAGFDEHMLKPAELDSLLDLLAEGGRVDQKLRAGT